MMGIVPGNYIIVKELEGGCTGDRKYMDNKGNIWKSNHGFFEDSTGCQHGRKIRNIIIPR
jgi:hypothetical protein